MNARGPKPTARWALSVQLLVGAGLAASLAAGPAAGQDAAGDRAHAERVAARAEALADAGRWREAALLFDAAWRADPTWPRTLRDKAYCLRKARKLDEAKAAYETLLEKWPGDPAATFGLAETERQRGDRAAAKRHFLDYLVREDRKGQEPLVEYATRKIAELSKPAPAPGAAGEAANPPAKTPPDAEPTDEGSGNEQADQKRPGRAPGEKAPEEKAPGEKAPEGKLVDTSGEGLPEEQPAEEPPPEASADAPAAPPRPASPSPLPERRPTRVLVAPPAGADEDLVVRRQLGAVLATELIRAGGLDVITPESLVAAGGGPGRRCGPDDYDCWSEAGGAGLRLRSDFARTLDGLTLTLRLTVEPAGRETAAVAVKGADRARLLESLPEGVAALLTAHALEVEAPDATAKPTARTRVDEREAAAEREAAEPEERAEEPAPAKRLEAERKIADGSKRRRSRLLGEADENERPAPVTTQVPADDGVPFYASFGWHSWTWSFVAVGAAVGASGLLIDALLPSSGNYQLDAADFIGPGALAVGLGAVVVGALLNPFWLPNMREDDDGD